jgi:prepilin-type N-terminal cleavage/methylation domain-containing protein
MRRGFTLIETLVILSIIGIIVVITVSSLALFRSSQGLDKDTETVVEVLQQARTQTLNSQAASQYGVHFSSTSTTLFVGPSYSPTASTNNVYPLQSADTILTITLVGGGSDVVFNRLTGETSQNGTILLQSNSSTKRHTVTIYKTGLVELQ